MPYHVIFNRCPVGEHVGADGALRQAMSMLFVEPRCEADFLEPLEAGSIVQWACGFHRIRIIPVPEPKAPAARKENVPTPTPYEALGAAIERERLGNQTWRKLQVLAALALADGDPPAWATLVADLATFELMPRDWRISVGQIGGGATLTLQRPDGATYCVAHGAPGDLADVVADFGRALIGAREGAAS